MHFCAKSDVISNHLLKCSQTICRSWSHFFASRIFCYILFADLVIKWFCFLILKTFVNINHWDCWKIRSFFNRSSAFPSPAQSIVSISIAFGIQFNVYFFLPENSLHSKEGFFHPFFSFAAVSKMSNSASVYNLNVRTHISRLFKGKRKFSKLLLIAMCVVFCGFLFALQFYRIFVCVFVKPPPPPPLSYELEFL